MDENRDIIWVEFHKVPIKDLKNEQLLLKLFVDNKNAQYERLEDIRAALEEKYKRKLSIQTIMRAFNKIDNRKVIIGKYTYKVIKLDGVYRLSEIHGIDSLVHTFLTEKQPFASDRVFRIKKNIVAYKAKSKKDTSTIADSLRRGFKNADVLFDIAINNENVYIILDDEHPDFSVAIDHIKHLPKSVIKAGKEIELATQKHEKLKHSKNGNQQNDQDTGNRE